MFCFITHTAVKFNTTHKNKHGLQETSGFIPLAGHPDHTVYDSHTNCVLCLHGTRSKPIKFHLLLLKASLMMVYVLQWP
jgi:hypothetical protein